MKSAEDIAKAIDEMTLDEMLAASGTIEAKPMAGGDHDSLQGWAKRLGIGERSVKKLVEWLVENGRAKMNVPGQTMRSGRPYPCPLVYAPDLAKREAGRE